jgi:hypothetical protein
VLKAYKVMFIKEMVHGENVCNFNDKGDLFYVILKGAVDVIVPIENEMKIDEKLLFIYLWENKDKICWTRVQNAPLIMDAIKKELEKLSI